MRIPIQLNVKGENILGVLHIPKVQAKASPVLIMCYGLDGNRVDNNRIAVKLGCAAEEKGVIFMRFDYRGLGVSEGEFWRMSLNTKKEDAMEVIKFLKGCFGVQGNTIMIIGFSDGVRVAMELAKEIKEIKGICLWNPIFFKFVSNYSDNRKIRLVREPLTKELVFPFPYTGLWMGCEHLREQTNMKNVFDDFIKYNEEKLVIFGGKDYKTKSSREKLEELKRDDHKFKSVIIEGADHVFSRNDWSDQLIDETLKWILHRTNYLE